MRWEIDFYQKALLAIHWAKINRIFPRIRAIELAIENPSVTIRVTVFEEISTEEKATLEEMKTCFIELFSPQELKNCTMEIVQTPFSKTIYESMSYFPETIYYSKTNKR